MSIIDDFTDAVSDAVDAIGDAGDLLGGVLKTVSPILGAIPGIGTAFAVAVYAAGALAAKDRLTDALIGTASAAMPPGVPRIAFDGAINVTRDVAEGRDVKDSVLGACRQAADKAGGGAAVQAFDSGLTVLRGGKLDNETLERLIDQGRAFALQGAGQAGAASFDAGVSIAQGNGADQVLIDVARGYIRQVGGPAALAGFDTGVALGHGKTLQEAGYIGLHTFVRGNSSIEKITNFVEAVGRSKNAREAVEQMLAGELGAEFTHAITAAEGIVAASSVGRVLQPYIDTIRADIAILEYPAGELASLWQLPEAIIRQAQALMRRGDGTIDEAMLENLRELADAEFRRRFAPKDHLDPRSTGIARVTHDGRTEGLSASDLKALRVDSAETQAVGSSARARWKRLLLSHRAMSNDVRRLSRPTVGPLAVAIPSAAPEGIQATVGAKEALASKVKVTVKLHQ